MKIILFVKNFWQLKNKNKSWNDEKLIIIIYDKINFNKNLKEKWKKKRKAK